MVILGVLHLLLALGGAFAGSFADGGNLWTYLLMIVIHPVAAVALLAMIVWHRPPGAAAIALYALVVLAVVGDVATSAGIALEAIRGDWWLLLIFTVVPLTGLAYVPMRRHWSRPA